MTNQKPLASLSLDLDNKWSYMKTHGDAGWETFPSYLDIVVPRVLEFLKKRELKITFFIVGQDATLSENDQVLRSIANAGHEIGNHSYLHEQWLHLYTQEEIEADLALAESHITRVTGQRPIGFRGPGYSCSNAVLRVLAQRGYLYDASTFPTYMGPLARAYYFATANLTSEEKEKRKKLFGTLRDGLRPLNAYRWRTSSEPYQSIIEIPVTTMPIVKVPIHASYIIYIGLISETLALLYFRLAMGICRLAGVTPSILLHPLDFLGSDDISELSSFPGMTLQSEKKLRIMEKIIDILQGQFEVVTLEDHALRVADIPAITELELNFETSGS